MRKLLHCACIGPRTTDAGAGSRPAVPTRSPIWINVIHLQTSSLGAANSLLF